MLVSSAASSSNTNTVTTPAINITGANAIIAVVAMLGAFNEADLTDSAGNSWAGTTLISADDGFGNITRILLKTSPSLSTTYQMTVTGSAIYPAASVIAVDGLTGADSVGSAANNGGGATSVQPGSFTPLHANELIVTGVKNFVASTFAVDSGFTVASQASGGTNGYSIGSGYSIQTSIVSPNPTWSWATSAVAVALQWGFIGTFTPGTGASSASSYLFFGQSLSDGLLMGAGAKLALDLQRNPIRSRRRLLSWRDDK